ncbi:MAG: hypothetical protein DIZ77_08140 [endosymbiont of Seepiophila jonesi]|uniref:Helicase HerA-like C-terminal domain-containing protein n=1 Tax=endosymbiont of Lamellibrachia luymesi TaxID=2200907 RepID=A0A370DW82_9GAMM|nr:MAG: hypothetical protein DIZ79_10360 [endosymbiont of Lamellibrachia luymesi]RDH92557.1 MAG: hypothetical protein DIZ77_08140 [endosymbiont of Seepiophila jonesi]
MNGASWIGCGLFGAYEQQTQEGSEEKAPKRSRSNGGRKRQGVGEAFVKSVARAIGSNLGQQIIRGILGSIIGKR